MNSDKGIRHFVTVFFAIPLAIAFFLLYAPAISNAGKVELEKLIEGAKKEKEVNFYHTTSVADGLALAQRFEKKYPFLKVKPYRAGQEKFLVRVMAEARAKRHYMDTVLAVGSVMHIIRMAGLLEKYISPEDPFFPTEYKDYGYWTTNYVNAYVNSYNTKLVSKDVLPVSYEDLLNPRWKGKMMMDPTKIDWVIGMIQIMGEEKAFKWMEALARQDVSYRIGHTLICQLIAAGEAELSVNQSTSSIESLAARGANLDWVAVGPVPGITVGSGVAAHAPHPNAARLLNDFMLSREGQSIWANFHRLSIRTDMPKSKKFKELKIVPVDPAMADNAKKYEQRLKPIFTR